ncbi:hypothetical protein B0H14DRAFT_3520321 [Mycena olivaceomarginata]|nr:hypothetical protein B0H14DRAFT_3520321 [Mycena olivaceomarginata]
MLIFPTTRSSPSCPPLPHSIEDIIPFIFYNTPNDSSVGTDALLDGSGNIDYQLPPYRLTDADVVPTPGRPLLTVSPSERGPSRVQVEGDSWPPFHFFSHPAIYRLMPFVRIPARIRRTDPLYLATILDRAVPVFETIQRSYALVSAVSQIVPARVQSGWTAFLPANEPATSPTWDTYSFISSVWLFPGTEEFPMDQPLRDPLSLADHTTLLRIARPNLRVLVHFMARNRINEVNGPQMAVSLLNEALAPAYPIFQLLINEFRAGHLSPTITHIIFNSVRALIAALPSEMRDPVWLDHLLPESPDHANRVLTPRLLIPRLPHEDLSSEPYPVMDMSDYDSMWYWWRRLQDEHPSAVAVRDARADSTSPHYRPTTPPSPSRSSTPVSPSTPALCAGLPFEARGNRGCSVNSYPSRNASRSPGYLSRGCAEQSRKLLRPMSQLPFSPRPARSTVRGRKTTRGKAPSAPSSSAANVDLRGRPLIRVRSSRKSVTPPVDEAYNEEGEEEREDDEDEELTPPRKRKRTDSRTPKGKSKAKSGTARAFLSFPLHRAQDPGQVQEGRAPPSLAKEQSEPTVFDAGCSNCVFRNRDCAHGVPGTLCDHCKKGRLSHCTHTFTVPEHVQAANYIEPYARLSNQRGNELLLDFSRLAVTSNRVGAWIREVTASLGADGLPGMDEIPEELQPLWGQLLLDSQAQLSIDYRAAILQYPFLSDTRRSGSTSDDELQELLDILARRAARNHQSTPPPRGELELARRGRGGTIGFEYRDIPFLLYSQTSNVMPGVAQFYSDCAAAFHLWDHAPIPISSFLRSGNRRIYPNPSP